jgi:hypothetical protein
LSSADGNLSSAARAAIPIAVLAAAMVTALLLPPIPQDPTYHDFADHRAWAGIPNALDVLSNLPFLAVGIAGLIWLARHRRGSAALSEPAEAGPWAAFFVGVMLTAPGSAAYHLDPDDHSLLWDRLPMTLCFMGLTTAILAEILGARRATRLLPPLVLLGIASVLYWYRGEIRGHGDLRFYGLVQFTPMVILPLLLLLYPARYTERPRLWAVFGLYVAAKGAELADRSIFGAVGFLSGHTFKHLLAAAATLMALSYLRRRRPVRPARAT